MDAYRQLESRFEKIGVLRQLDGLLDWDRSVLMPEKAVQQRARQVETLALMAHELQTDPALGKLLDRASLENLDDWQHANLRQMQWSYAHATALPAELIEKKIGQETRTELIWRRARAENNFSLVEDELSRLVDIVRETARIKSEKLKLPVYDALMDTYVRDMPSSEVDAIFDDVAAFLPGLVKEILATQQEPLPVKGPFPVEIQEKLGRKLCELLGVDFKWARLDRSTHPFSSGTGDDIRVTTRYNPDTFINSLQAVAHEVGHGLYNHNAPEEWRSQPVGAAGNMGMAIHESQSLSLDMQLARSREYWEFMTPMIAKAFNRSGPEWSAENVYRTVTKVSRSFIRVEADEVTYPAHVILRYRIEKRLVTGALEVRDLPAAWREGMQALIGAEPPTDTQGCLQDIHWYFGAFGYFPAYALGAFTAAQLAAAMKRATPDWAARVRSGDFTPYTHWLRDNVQSKACLYPPGEMIEKATGEKFSTRYFKNHLSERYLGRPYKG